MSGCQTSAPVNESRLIKNHSWMSDGSYWPVCISGVGRGRIHNPPLNITNNGMGTLHRVVFTAAIFILVSDFEKGTER